MMPSNIPQKTSGSTVPAKIFFAIFLLGALFAACCKLAHESHKNVNNAYVQETLSDYIAPLGSLTVKIPKSRAPFAPEASLSVPIQGKRYFNSTVTFLTPFTPKNDREAKALRELTPPWVKDSKDVLIIEGLSARATPSTIIHNVLQTKQFTYGAYGCTLRKEAEQIYSLNRYHLDNCVKVTTSSQDKHFFIPVDAPLSESIYIECTTAQNNHLMTGTCFMHGYPGSNVELKIFFPMDLLYRWSEMWSLAVDQLNNYTIT